MPILVASRADGAVMAPPRRAVRRVSGSGAPAPFVLRSGAFKTGAFGNSAGKTAVGMASPLPCGRRVRDPHETQLRRTDDHVANESLRRPVLTCRHRPISGQGRRRLVRQRPRGRISRLRRLDQRRALQRADAGAELDRRLAPHARLDERSTPTVRTIAREGVPWPAALTAPTRTQFVDGTPVASESTRRAVCVTQAAQRVGDEDRAGPQGRTSRSDADESRERFRPRARRPRPTPERGARAAVTIEAAILPSRASGETPRDACVAYVSRRLADAVGDDVERVEVADAPLNRRPGSTAWSSLLLSSEPCFGFGPSAPASAHQRGHRRDQLAGVDRLRQVHLEAALQRPGPVFRTGKGRQRAAGRSRTAAPPRPGRWRSTESRPSPACRHRRAARPVRVCRRRSRTCNPEASVSTSAPAVSQDHASAACRASASSSTASTRAPSGCRASAAGTRRVDGLWRRDRLLRAPISRAGIRTRTSTLSPDRRCRRGPCRRAARPGGARSRGRGRARRCAGQAGLRLRELVEDVRQELGAMPMPVSADRDLGCASSTPLQPDLHAAPVGVNLTALDEQVPDDLPQRGGITRRPAPAGDRSIASMRMPFASAAGCTVSTALLRSPRQLDRLDVEPDLAGDDARDVEHVLDDCAASVAFRSIVSSRASPSRRSTSARCAAACA